jgi:ABC-type dipeptide/oligopeptide/nickel transport system ATPase component
MSDPTTATTEPLLDVRGLQKFFPITRGYLQRTVGHVRAVDGVDFTVKEGETLGLVGESGCGKTTASRCILRAIDPTGGQILYRTRAGKVVDLASLPPAELLPQRAETSSPGTVTVAYAPKRGGIAVAIVRPGRVLAAIQSTSPLPPISQVVSSNTRLIQRTPSTPRVNDATSVLPSERRYTPGTARQ